MKQWQAWQNLLDDRLWSLLLAYLEWRTIQGCPKVRQTMRASESPSAELVYRLVPGSTRQPDPGRTAIFGQVWTELEDYEGDWVRRIILDFVECKDEPWLRGRLWRRKIESWRLSPRRYETLLLDAWSILTEASRKRGLLPTRDRLPHDPRRS